MTCPICHQAFDRWDLGSAVRHNQPDHERELRQKPSETVAFACRRNTRLLTRQAGRKEQTLSIPVKSDMSNQVSKLRVFRIYKKADGRFES